VRYWEGCVKMVRKYVNGGCGSRTMRLTGSLTVTVIFCSSVRSSAIQKEWKKKKKQETGMTRNSPEGGRARQSEGGARVTRTGANAGHGLYGK